jgi:hypothetical protein
MTEKVRLSLLAVALLAGLCACAGPDALVTEASPEASPPPASGVPIMLYTHCGIKELRVDDTYFLAETPLDDGQGNPPAGWGNPYQAGTVSLSGSKAVFRDDKGHIITFLARPGATGFLNICS